MLEDYQLAEYPKIKYTKINDLDIEEPQRYRIKLEL